MSSAKAQFILKYTSGKEFKYSAHEIVSTQIL